MRHIGLQVDPLSVCSLLFELTNQGQFCGETSIASIYTFLNKFHWRPEVPDETELKVYVHDHGWFDPQDCVLHDEKNLFRTSLCSLDQFYDEELLPLFSSAFGVAENPTIDHYLELWETCDSWVNHRVINLKTLCCSFWEYVIANWNSEVAETLRQKLTKLPSTKSTSEKKYLTNRTEVFLADDLQLKKNFLRYDEAPLFVWFPTTNGLSPRRLYEIYESLGVKKVSESVQCIPYAEVYLDTKRDAICGFVDRGLVKIILGFLAGPQVNMPLEERRNAASSIFKLVVYKIDEPYRYICRLMRSESTRADVKHVKLVSLKKKSGRLLIDNSGYTNRKSDLQFVAAFADELAQGLLEQARVRPYTATLSKLDNPNWVYV